MASRWKLRWAIGGLVRTIFRRRIVSIKSEAGVPFRFRPGEYPLLLKGARRVDPWIRDRWSRLLQPGDCIVDVGANIGFTVHRFHAILGGECDIFAFEPMPRNFALLAANVAALGSDRIHTVNAAVGAENGNVEFCDNTKHGALSRQASSVDKDNDRWPLYWDTYAHVLVKMIRLDTFVAGHDACRPTVLKIDVEGAGVSVLEGAGEVLAARRPLLSCEFHSAQEGSGMKRIVGEAGYVGVAFRDDGTVVLDDVEASDGNFVHPSDPRVARLGLQPPAGAP